MIFTERKNKPLNTQKNKLKYYVEDIYVNCGEDIVDVAYA